MDFGYRGMQSPESRSKYHSRSRYWSLGFGLGLRLEGLISFSITAQDTQIDTPTDRPGDRAHYVAVSGRQAAGRHGRRRGQLPARPDRLHHRTRHTARRRSVRLYTPDYRRGSRRVSRVSRHPPFCLTLRGPFLKRTYFENMSLRFSAEQGAS